MESPASNPLSTQRWSPRAKTAVGALLLLGALLRLVLFLADNSLWHDEAMLAANLVERDYAGLREPLYYGQVAPIGYLYAQRFIIENIGGGERSLRLMSLLPSLLALPVFVLLARRLLPVRGVVFAVLLFSLSEPLIYYAMELKPYAWDVLTSITLVWLAVRMFEDGYRKLDIVAFTLVAALGLFFSYPLVFMVLTTGGLLVLFAFKQKRAVDAILVAGGCAIAAGVFLWMKQSFMQESSSVAHHRGFWEAHGGFMPVPPKSLRDLEWFVRRPLDFFVDPMRYKAFGLAMVLALIGATALWRRDRLALAMLLVPVPLAALVSVTKMYPFGTQDELRHPMLGRVLLFIVPLVLILMGRGVQWVADAAGRYRAPVLAALLAVLLAHPLLNVVDYIRNPDDPHDAKPALEVLNRHAKPGDFVYVNYPAMMLSKFYWRRSAEAQALDVTFFTAGDPATPLSETTRDGNYMISIGDYSVFERVFRQVKGRRVWVFFVHAPDLEGRRLGDYLGPNHRADEKFLQWYLPTVGKRIAVPGGKPDGVWQQSNASLHLYEMNP